MSIKKVLPPRPPGFPLRAPLALRLSRILIAPDANLTAHERFGVVGAVRALRLAFQQRRGAFLAGEGFVRAGGEGAGDGFFGAADGHFVQAVLAEQGFAGRGRDVAAHVVEGWFLEEGF